MSQSEPERRRHPRAKGVAGLTIGAGPDVIGVQIKDISLSGLSFCVGRPIEFMTRLVMTIVFPPLSDRKRKSRSPLDIQCEGAVVRCDPAGDRRKRYEVAVFFTHLEDEAREVIEQYVKTQLETRTNNP